MFELKLKLVLYSRIYKKKTPDKIQMYIYLKLVYQNCILICTDGKVKLWVYAVTAVGFILILFIIALSFLVWYV